MIYQPSTDNSTGSQPVKKKSPDLLSRHPLINRVQNLIVENRLIAKDDILITAVSGGPDSMALLHLLSRMSIHSGIFAIYVDHGLRPDETGAEIEMVQKLCRSLQVPFESVAIDVRELRRRTGSSLEEAARNLRYAVLEAARIRHGASVIAVAHTADDQAEEILLRLIRGSGREGLCGMALRRGALVRPLLQERKESLISYLNEIGLPFCLDSSNQSRSFLRNRVRLDLLPYLEGDFNPSIRKTLLQTSEILRCEEDLLLEISREAYGRLVQKADPEDSAGESCLETVRMETRPFLDTHPAIQRRILEKVLWQMGTPPAFRQIDRIRNLIKNCSNGAEIHLGYGLRVWKAEGAIVFSHPGGRRGYRGSGHEETTISTIVDGPGVFHLAGHRLAVHILPARPADSPGRLLLDADRISFPLLLRNPLPDERFQPLGASGSKKITRFLSDAKIPRRSRGNFPVLVAGGTIVAVVGMRIAHTFRIQDDTRRFLAVEWQRVSSSSA